MWPLSCSCACKWVPLLKKQYKVQHKVQVYLLQLYLLRKVTKKVTTYSTFSHYWMPVSKPLENGSQIFLTFLNKTFFRSSSTVWELEEHIQALPRYLYLGLNVCVGFILSAPCVCWVQPWVNPIRSGKDFAIKIPHLTLWMNRTCAAQPRLVLDLLVLIRRTDCTWVEALTRLTCSVGCLWWLARCPADRSPAGWRRGLCRGRPPASAASWPGRPSHRSRPAAGSAAPPAGAESPAQDTPRCV